MSAPAEKVRTTRQRHGSAAQGPELPPSLLHPFRLIAFDWDGTAVENRSVDASPVRIEIERLLRAGVYVAVITGTNFGHVDRQLASAIHGPHKRRLLALTQRGSEVWTFDDASRPVLTWHRVATPEEDGALTAAADATRAALVRRTGLDIRVVYDRLNRRKVDLIPEPEWADPPKSAIGALHEAVEARLTNAGLEGGIGEAFRIAEQMALEHGLRDARITSDVKHIEIGLTDKSDSIEWLMRELASAERIGTRDVLIGGDEFGRVAGFEGSDARMLTPSARGATFVSVGPEPGGAPPEVIHLGGGPERFRELLAAQARIHERRVTSQAEHGESAHRVLPVEPTTDPRWVLAQDHLQTAREHEFESIFTVSNGYVGTRGSLAEGGPLSAPATFLAGVYDLHADSPSVPVLAAAPNWTRMIVTLDGHPLDLDRGEALEHRRVLDLRQGLLWREWRHRDVDGRVIRFRGLRLASLADRHALLQVVTIMPENFGGTLHITLVLEPPPTASSNPFGTGATLVPVTPIVPDGRTVAAAPVAMTAHTRATDIAAAFASAGTIHPADAPGVESETVLVDGAAAEHYSLAARIGTTYRLDWKVAVCTSRDAETPAEAAATHLGRLVKQGADRVISEHVNAWQRRWRAADVEIIGEDDAQKALRFACYHLIAAANPEDERVSVGARALTGPAYSGHVFWDTEIYMLPFYIYTHPPSARALLMYRYHTLPAAREKARAHELRGAFYAWESAADGHEATPTQAITPSGRVLQIRNGEQEVHICADVAYGVWQYWQATGDDAFFRDAGAEILLETARFWASRGRLEDDGRFHFRHVIGPDEYHEDVDDDAYTNGMARWNLERGADAARILAERWPDRWSELRDRLDLDDETEHWRDLARATALDIDPDTGLIEQFPGYFDLDEIDLAEYEPRSAPMDVILGRERTQRSQIIKQPDVLMLIYLLWDDFPPEVRAANFEYYDRRTGHGSSLSPSIHALLAARLGRTDLARKYFRQAAEIDLANNMGNAAGGVHMASLGGLWQAVVHGFAGTQFGPDGPTFEPKPLPEWREIRFNLHWRDASLQVTVDAEGATVQRAPAAPPPA